MRQQSSEYIPEQALNPKIFNNDDQNSNMFKVDHTQQINIQHLHFFNKDTQIIKPGEKRKVLIDKLQTEKRSFYQIVSPYLYKALENTGKFAVSAYGAVKDGIGWAYGEMVQKVIPFASQKLEQLPQFIFLVTKKGKNKKFENSDQFCFLDMQEQDANAIQKKQKKGKIKIVIPLGQSDPQFEEFLKKQSFQQKYSFPIDVDSEDLSQENKIIQSRMIPSQSFQFLYQDIKNMQGYKKAEEKPIIHILPKCAIFQLQGKNSIEYQLLDRIEKHENTQSGYIVIPQQIIKKQSKDSSQGDIPFQTVKENKKVEQKKIEYPLQMQEMEQMKDIAPQKKVVDRTRNVRVQIPELTAVLKNKNNKQQKRQVMYQ